MEFEILNKDSLTKYVRMWKSSDWDKVLYSGDVLNTDCMAFGIQDKGRPKALMIVELMNEQAEIKILNFDSHNALKILIETFSDYCHSIGIIKLIYELRMKQNEETVFREIMVDNGWNEPQVKYKLYELKKSNTLLSKRTKGNKSKGKVVPFFETSLKQRCELTSKLPEDSMYYQIEYPEKEFCIAYVEDNVIKGFVLSENIEGRLYLNMDKMSMEPLAIADMLCEVAYRLEKNNIYKVYVIVKEKYGEQLIKNLFLNQIVGSEIIIYRED